MSDKKYDVIIMGASGFTGRLVAEYYLKQYGLDKELKWAMAGRNLDKLKKVSEELGSHNIPIVIADSHDSESLDKMTAATKVVCTTVGPYAKYGSELVASCVKNGTHYADLAGEVQWMRKMIDLHHIQAEKNEVKIVHTCGFDSIPSDMGVFFLQGKAKEKLGSYCHHIKFRLKAAKGGFSGGTYASLNNVLVEAGVDKSIYGVLLDPYGLNPEGMREGPDGRDLTKVIFDKDLKIWIAPFIMAMINTKVVRRSNALSDFVYGKEFRYDEAVITGKGLGGKIKGNIMRIGLGFLMAKPGTFINKIVSRFLPDPGQGPGKEERENGFFNVVLWGKTKNGEVLRAKVTGDKDPGYGSTAKMLGESAVCLAHDTLPHTHGVLTPSTAMGEALLTRLQTNAGLSFEMKE